MIVEGAESDVSLIRDLCDRGRRDTLPGEHAASSLDQLAAGLQLAPSAPRDTVTARSAVSLVTGFFIGLRHRSPPSTACTCSTDIRPSARRPRKGPHDPATGPGQAADGKPGAEIVSVHVFPRMLR